MEKFQAFAHPWWVNLLIVVPAAAYFLWRRKGLGITLRKKLIITAFALAFGFVEAAGVVFLRAGGGLFSSCNGRAPLGSWPFFLRLPHSPDPYPFFPHRPDPR